MKYFVTAIDTDSGKTLVASILCEALHADYWKPIQAGLPRDSDTVRELVSNPTTKVHPERYLLKTPASPHAAARLDGIEIKLQDFKIPVTTNNLVIEGAGGCLVPLNDREFVVDLISHFAIEIILVADLYLGSINHTLLTIEALRARNLLLKGIVFNGEANPESQRIILHHAKVPCLLHIKKEKVINNSVVSNYASMIKDSLK